MLGNHAWIKDPLKAQDRPINFIVTEEEFSLIVREKENYSLE